MACPRCKSEDVNFQVVNEINFKKGHGCILTILFGIWYWLFWLAKWFYKISIYLVYQFYRWFFVFPVKRIYYAIRKKPFNIAMNMQPSPFIVRMMQKANRTYNMQKSLAVCQSCGNKWNPA